MRADHLAVFVSYWLNETADRSVQVDRANAEHVKLEIGRRNNSGELIWIIDYPIAEESAALTYAHIVAETFECGVIITEEP